LREQPLSQRAQCPPHRRVAAGRARRAGGHTLRSSGPLVGFGGPLERRRFAAREAKHLVTILHDEAAPSGALIRGPILVGSTATVVTSLYQGVPEVYRRSGSPTRPGRSHRTPLHAVCELPVVIPDRRSHYPKDQNRWNISLIVLRFGCRRVFFWPACNSISYFKEFS
jgi:hypothetical protein